MTLPTLTTARLVLRPFTLADAPVVQRLVGDAKVADTTLNIPHPYPDGAAEAWIAKHPAAWEQGAVATFAITTANDGLVGAIGIHLSPAHARGEMGYWIGPAWWNKGFATEAAAEVLRFGFEELGLERIQASHMPSNPSSGRVMQKIGMTLEGVHRAMYRKNGRPVDVAMYAMLRDDWARRRAGG